MQSKTVSLLVGIGLVSFLPIWRSANATDLPLNFWEYLIYSSKLAAGFETTHIPYEEAKDLARTAFRSRE